MDELLDDIPYCKDNYNKKPNNELEEEIEANKRKFNKEIRVSYDNRATTTNGYNTAFQEPGDRSEKNKETIRDRLTSTDIFNDMVYTDHNHLPIAAGYKSHDYEYGYSYIPPEKWYPQPVRPPICATNKPLEVVPTLAEGTPTNLKEFYSSSHITGPSQISSKFIYDRLNS